jgi:hypothetical protein
VRYQLPPGPGRPKGSRNKRTIALGGGIDRLVTDEKLIRLLWKLAQRGDARAAIYLADRKWGRPVAAPQVNPEAPRVIVVKTLGIPID